MKMPKFVLRIGFQEYAVPHNSGLSALMGLLADAIPVDADLHNNQITLQHVEEGDESMLTTATMVSIKRIPPGVQWKRRTREGHVEIIRPVPLERGQRSPAKQPRRLNGRHLQLEFGR